ncbi:MAG: M14 family metallopeptidase, partial [Melioribacteraceae bacterium]
ILTVAEKSNFESTSRYSEVMDFFKQLKKISPNIKIESIGKSIEGRDIPLIIIGKPLIQSIKNLKKEKRIVVYIQANIHAGEVEGKEAVQMLARDILLKETPNYLNDILLLVCPIFNSDGNEQINKQNRTNQNGPVNGVGVRHNGQMLDLNRDAMKVETPEVYGLIKNILNRWDPAIMLDLHTTNGSYHTEPLTYTWMMNGNTDRKLINYMRDKMAPWLKTTIIEKYSTPNVFYGEFRDMRNPEKGWDSYAFEPRYIVNYIGLRNRLSILNENYVHADFKSRVLGCYSLLRGVLDYASANKDEIKNMLRNADERTISRGMNPTDKDSFAVKFVNNPTPAPEVINAYEMESYKDANGRDRLKPGNRIKKVTVPYFADYFPERSVQFPYAYILTVPDAKVVELLKTHGIKIEKLENTVSLDVETIKIKELKPAARLNQGHYTNSVKVEYLKEKREFAAGCLIVRTAQPLANVAAYLLEPETDDGLLLWNYWDKYLVPQWGGAFLPYPVAKVLNAAEIKSKPIELK